MVKDNQMSSGTSITIFHQNICGLKGKTDELISSMSPDFPHILCFSEHHLKKPELDQTWCCILQTSCKKRQCLYICQKNLKYSITDLDKYCKDQDIEVRVLKLKSTFFNVCIIAVYRARTGNFNLFLNRIDDINKTLYKDNTAHYMW